MDELAIAASENRKLIFLDEISFTKTSILRKEWSQKNDNQKIDQRAIYNGYRSVISAVSEEKGNEYYKIYEKAVDSIDFEGYL